MDELLFTFSQRLQDQSQLSNPIHHKSIFLLRQKNRIFKQNSTLKLIRAIKNPNESSYQQLVSYQRLLYTLLLQMMTYYSPNIHHTPTHHPTQDIITLFRSFFTHDQSKIKGIIRHNNHAIIPDLIQLLLDFSRKKFNQILSQSYNEYIETPKPKLENIKTTKPPTHQNDIPQQPNTHLIHNISLSSRYRKSIRFIQYFNEREIETKTNQLYFELWSRNTNNHSIILNNYSKCYGNKQLICYNYSNLYTHQQRQHNLIKLKQEIHTLTQKLSTPHLDAHQSQLKAHLHCQIQLNLKKAKLQSEEQPHPTPINSMVNLYLRCNNNTNNIQPLSIFLISKGVKYTWQQYRKQFKLATKHYLKNHITNSNHKIYNNDQAFEKCLRGQYYLNKMLEQAQSQKYKDNQHLKQQSEQQPTKQLSLPSIHSSSKFSFKQPLSSNQIQLFNKKPIKLRTNFAMHQINSKKYQIYLY